VIKSVDEPSVSKRLMHRLLQLPRLHQNPSHPKLARSVVTVHPRRKHRASARNNRRVQSVQSGPTAQRHLLAHRNGPRALNNQTARIAPSVLSAEPIAPSALPKLTQRTEAQTVRKRPGERSPEVERESAPAVVVAEKKAGNVLSAVSVVPENPASRRKLVLQEGSTR
jgi:hypothetical protein